jgi:hypothetical protein
MAKRFDRRAPVGSGVLDTAQANKAAYERRPTVIEIVIGAIKVRVPGGANTRDVAAVLRAVRGSHA